MSAPLGGDFGFPTVGIAVDDGDDAEIARVAPSADVDHRQVAAFPLIRPFGMPPHAQTAARLRSEPELAQGVASFRGKTVDVAGKRRCQAVGA